MRKLTLFTVCYYLSMQYVGIMWGLPEPYWLHYTQKPFIYRHLVPTLASFLPFDIRTSILIVTLAFCAGLILVMLHVYEENFEQTLRNDVAFLISFFLTIIIVSRYSNYYDIPSAFFFTLLTVLWRNKKYAVSIPVFALSCLNRETTVLLIPYFLITQRRLFTTTLLTLVYVVVRSIVLFSFSDTSGETVYFRFADNLAIHANYAFATVVLVVFFTSILILFLYKYKCWQYATFVFLTFPALIGIYLIAGYPFEIRVFVEVFPIMFMGAFLMPS